MRLVRQRNDTECGVVVAAMICGASRSTALRSDTRQSASHGMDTKQFLVLCLRLGCSIAMTGGPRFVSIKEARPPAGCVAAMIHRKDSPMHGHYVAIDSDGSVLDPHEGRVAWRMFRRRAWFVSRWFIDKQTEAPGNPRASA